MKFQKKQLNISRKWKPVINELQIEKIKKNEFPIKEFKIASYNLLSPKLLDENFYLYENLDKNYLNWKYRRTNLLKEIKKINAHVSKKN